MRNFNLWKILSNNYSIRNKKNFDSQTIHFGVQSKFTSIPIKDCKTSFHCKTGTPIVNSDLFADSNEFTTAFESPSVHFELNDGVQIIAQLRNEKSTVEPQKITRLVTPDARDFHKAFSLQAVDAHRLIFLLWWHRHECLVRTCYWDWNRIILF